VQTNAVLFSSGAPRKIDLAVSFSFASLAGVKHT